MLDSDGGYWHASQIPTATFISSHDGAAIRLNRSVAVCGGGKVHAATCAESAPRRSTMVELPS